MSILTKAGGRLAKACAPRSRGWLMMLIICTLLPMRSASAADPCENYRRPRGSTEDTSAMSLAERAARVAAGDQTVLMGGRGPAADYAVDPSALEKLTPQGKFALCWFAELEGNLHKLDQTLATYEQAYKCLDKQEKLDQIDLDKNRVRFILKELPSFASGNIRSRGSGGWVIFYQWEVRDFTNTKEFKMFQRWLPEVKQHIADYETDLKPFMAQLATQGACTGGRVSTFEYRMYLVGKDVLVGQSDVLKAIPTCRLKGWGTDCRPLGTVLQEKGEDLYPASGQYKTLEEATRFFCDQIVWDKTKGQESPRGVLLTGGRDREARLKSDNQYHNIQNAPSCPEKP